MPLFTPDDPEALARAMNITRDVVHRYNREAVENGRPEEQVDFDQLPFAAQRLITTMISPPKSGAVEVVILVPPPIHLYPVEPCLGAVHRN